MQVIAVFFLVSSPLAAWSTYSCIRALSGEKKAEQRLQSVAKTEPLARATRGPQKSARSVEATLKDLEEDVQEKQKSAISVRIAQAGLSWSKRQFGFISAGMGLATFSVSLFFWYWPDHCRRHWLCWRFRCPALASILFEKAPRKKKSCKWIPDAVHAIIVRVKAGLPLLDCIKMIALEAPIRPKSEFLILENRRSACRWAKPAVNCMSARHFRRQISSPSWSRFSKVGGNSFRSTRKSFARAPDRKKLKAKIRKAMSWQEAKAFARHHRRTADRSDDAGLPHQPAKAPRPPPVSSAT